MNERTTQVDNPPILADRGSVDKRAMLSLNSALASLGPLFQQENERRTVPIPTSYDWGNFVACG
ncbi:hypothetical protein DPMN_046752 [Dreissena polymorpha]|uniref:Uncharacterized protein n=1 Tax=Dreissena polymorpha TaxID=45954 RepID=A0A9D4D7F1_DREPO|nr:hypothetical protein DPMN_046752 [Dreissena polymorpha]